MHKLQIDDILLLSSHLPTTVRLKLNFKSNFSIDLLLCPSQKLCSGFENYVCIITSLSVFWLVHYITVVCGLFCTVKAISVKCKTKTSRYNLPFSPILSLLSGSPSHTSSISGSQLWLSIKNIWGALKTNHVSPDSDVVIGLEYSLTLRGSRFDRWF